MVDSSKGRGPSDGAHLVEPPIIDLMRWDAERRCFVMTFVPQDKVSAHPTEVVDVYGDGVEGRAIDACLRNLAAALGLASPISRIVHAGGGDFTFHATDGTVVALSDARFTPDTTTRVYDLLQRISQDTENAFLIDHPPQVQSHPVRAVSRGNARR